MHGWQHTRNETGILVRCNIGEFVVLHDAGECHKRGIRQQATVMLPRSEFLNQMGVASVNRTNGLTAQEAAPIVADVGNL